MFDWISDAVGWISEQAGNVSEDFVKELFNIFLMFVYDSVYNTVSEIFGMLNDIGSGIFELSWTGAFTDLFEVFGRTLFAAGLVVAVFDLALEYNTGRANIQGTCLNILKGFMAAGLFTKVPVVLYNFCISLQMKFSNDMTVAFLKEYFSDVGDAANKALKLTVGMNSLLGILSIILLAYCVLKLFFANLKRGGILLCQIAVGSLYMFLIPRGFTDGFNSWCKQIFALCLTAFLQTSLMFLGLLTWQTNMILAVGILLSANEVPRIAQQFGLDTSIKVNMMSVNSTINTAVRAGQFVARKLA